MATTEKVGIFTHVDDKGNTTLLYPVTKMEAVDRLQETIDHVEQSIENLNAHKVDISRVVNNFTTTKEGFVADARALKVLNDSKLSLDLLWENSSPNSAFAKQTINLDLSGYKEVLVLGRNATSTQVIVGYSGYLQRIIVEDADYYSTDSRAFVVSTNGVDFRDCYQMGWYKKQIPAPTINNSLLQPIKIYGIK